MIAPEIVISPGPPIVVAAAKVTPPLTVEVFEVSELIKAPLVLKPVPLKLNILETL